jgi:hypothetical protein
MLLSYLYPFPFRNTNPPLTWVYYRQLGQLPPEEVEYVGSAGYFEDPVTVQQSRPWEISPLVQQQFGFGIPTTEQVAGCRQHWVELDLYDKLLSEQPSGLRAWASLMTRPYGPLCKRLEEVFRDAASRGPIEAVLTWCNCASLRKVAQRFKVPVIHNELGALRAPTYQRTVYFDFSGVNAYTESEPRYRRFKAEVQCERAPLFSVNELRALIGGPTLQSIDFTDPSYEYDLGLALQVEDDSNLIAYGNGFNNYELILTAMQHVEPKRVLIRTHPHGALDYRRIAWKGVQFDESPTSVEFVRRCRSVVTINSSVGIESLLLGRRACVLGQNPFDFMAARRIDEVLQPTELSPELVTQLNFAVLAYLIPEPLLFDLPYYRWRLQRPSELDIYRLHANYYQTGEVQYETTMHPPSRSFLMPWRRRLSGVRRSA